MYIKKVCFPKLTYIFYERLKYKFFIFYQNDNIIIKYME